MIRKLTFITSLVCGTFLALTASPCDAQEPPQQGQRLGTDVRIEVDTQQQQVRVYSNQSLIKAMPCSTGKSETPTPMGSFKTFEKVTGRAIELDGKEVSYYFVSYFDGHFGFHSGIFGDHPMVQEGEQKFEKRLPSTGGCVRLHISDAHWIYENIGLGATVDIR